MADWRSPVSKDEQILRPVNAPFDVHGGLSVLGGNLGKAIVKTSAIAPDLHVIEGEVRIFHSQECVQKAFKAGELNRDVIVVVRFQGPRANGMPELHKLLPPLQAVQSAGFKVALVTDGRLSGASGEVLSAIHLTPRGRGGWADCEAAGWRSGKDRLECGRADGAGGRGGMGGARGGDVRIFRRCSMGWGESCSACFGGR